MKLKANRDQLWAEAVYYYKEKLAYVENLIRKVNADMKELQIEHTAEDPLEEGLHIYLDTILPADWYEQPLYFRQSWFKDDHVRLEHYRDYSHDGDFVRTEFSVHDFYIEYLCKDIGSYNYVQDFRRVHAIMDKMPEWQKQPKPRRIHGDNPRTVYVRILQPDSQTGDATQQVNPPVPQQMQIDFPNEASTYADEALPF